MLPVAIVAVLVAGSLLPLVLGPAAGMEPDVYTMKVFDSGNTKEVMDFDGPGEDRTTVSLDPMAVVLNGSLNATSGPHTPGEFDYPLDPAIDIGDDGKIDWRFNGLGYGRWGLQDVFHDGASEINLTFEENTTREVRFKLPKGADIKGGAFTTGGWPIPYWGPEAVISNTSTESDGEYGPVFTVFKERMYVAWESMDPAITDGDDLDIVIRWFDGEKWGPYIELSPPADTFQDDAVNLVVYKDKLYAVWSASVDLDFFSDDDLVMRWSDDGDNWSPMKKVSPVLRQGMNDWPALQVYKDKLYIIWKTTDSTISDGDDMDIVYRWWDGSSFGPIEELTAGDGGRLDWAYDTTVYNDRLWVVWEKDISSGLFGYEVNILIRSYDGVSWSNTKDLTGADDTVKDEIPRIYVWSNPVKKRDELYVIWGRGEGSWDGSGDIDIVIRVFDGTTWSEMQELSQPGIRVQNMGHQLIGYEDRLYAIWIHGNKAEIIDQNDNLIVYKIWGDIMIRSFDGYDWSSIKELTPTGQTDEASDPEICVYDGKLYASWSFPNDKSSGSGQHWDIIFRNIDFQDVTLEIDVGGDGSLEWEGEIHSSQEIVPLDGDGIEAAMIHGSITDDYGNEITEIPVKIKSRYPARISAHDLKIEYSYPQHFDFKDKYNQVLEANRPSAQNGTGGRQPLDKTPYTFSASSGSEGKIIFEELDLDYIVNLWPFLVGPIPALSFDEDTDYLHAVDLEEHFSDDWDDGQLSFRITENDNWNGVEARTEGRFLNLFTPTENWNGVTNITVVAEDRYGLISEPHTFLVTVLPVNDPPILDFIANKTMKLGDRFVYTASAHDVDGDVLTFSDNTDYFNIDKETGIISFAPSERGLVEATVRVDDGYGGNDTETFSINVIGESTSATEESCFSMLAVVILIVAIVLVLEKWRRMTFADREVPPEKIQIRDEDVPPEDRVETEKRRKKSRSMWHSADKKKDSEITSSDWEEAEELLRSRKQARKKPSKKT
jgi:hypothetical protein